MHSLVKHIWQQAASVIVSVFALKCMLAAQLAL